MIEIIIILILFVIGFALNEIPMLPEIKLTIQFIVISSLCFYIAMNINDRYLTYTFMILSIISILLIPFTLIIKYMEKILK
jgi:hypothetical protein